MTDTLPCRFEPLADSRPCRWRCPTCGYTTKAASDTPPAKNCRGSIRTPSLVTQLGTAATAAVRFAAGGFHTLPAEQVAERLTICRACPGYDAEAKRCLYCGCYVEIKAELPAEVCPLGKWAEVKG